MTDHRRVLWTKLLKHKKPTAFSVQAHPFRGIVLGVDPSLRGTGFFLLKVLDAHSMERLDSLTLTLSPKESFVACLGKIFSTTEQWLEKIPVQAVAIERTIYVQNSRTAHILGSARGACLAAVALRSLPVMEFSPARIKKAATGNGQATKEQVAHMVKQILHLPQPLPPDESDAAAAALCYVFSLKSLKGPTVS